MKTTLLRLFIGSFFILTTGLYAQINPGIDFDLQGFINAELSAGKTTIRIPEGRHRVSPKTTSSNSIITLSNLNNITIVADSAEMICTETVQAIRIVNCNNLKIQGLKIDYDPLPFTQGRIIALSPDKSQITIDIIDGYSTTVTGDKVEIFDETTGELAVDTYYGASTQVDVPNRRAVITKPLRSFDNKLQLGQIVVLDSRGTRTIPHTINPDRCTNLVLENVVSLSSTSFSFFETSCKGSKYINCAVDRRPLDSETRSRGLRRMRSGNLDGFHSKYAEIGPSYVGCIARYNGDDSYAINGDFDIITEANGNILTIVVKGGGSNTPDYTIGETVELTSYTGERIPDAKVVQVAQGRALNQTEYNFLVNRTTFRGEAALCYTAHKVYYITIDRSVSLPLGSLINSATRVGNGFEIRNCIAGPNRSRGILVKAGNGIITGNKCVGNWGIGIKCSPEYDWLEGPSGSNIGISDNEIIGCRAQSISIVAVGGNGNVPPAGAHDYIRFINNVITNPLASPAIVVSSTSNLCFNGNTYNIGDPQVSLTNVTYATQQVSSISVTPATVTLPATQTSQLAFTVLPAFACYKFITWSSDKPLIVNVDANGFVTALSAGTAIITAKTDDGMYMSTCTVTVSSALLIDTVTSVSGPPSVAQGQTVTVEVPYSASVQRDIIVYFQQIGTFAGYGGSKATVNAGSGTAYLNLAINANSPIANANYRYTAFITTVGGEWNQRVGGDGVQQAGISVTATVLPVKLLSFNAEKANQAVNLSWTTAAEVNNKEFGVQRSETGEKWNHIAVVKGKDTASGTFHYTTTDILPLPGVNYYRLRQTDFDGVSVYSKVVVIDFSGNATEALKVYPNPAKGRVNVISSSFAGKVGYTIFGADVRQVGSGVLQNTISATGINISYLKPGIYLLKLQNEKKTITTKFMVQ